MTIVAEQLDGFAALATAIGLLREGEISGAWFENPIGSATNPVQPGLSTMAFVDEQRQGLVDFIDEVLGPPGQSVRDGQVWVPLFSSPDPAVTLFSVLEERAGVVDIGVGVEHRAGTAAPSVATRLHVPIFQLDRAGTPDPPSGGGMPDWIRLGRAGARIELTAEVTLSTDPAVPGQPHLGGLGITLGIPTNGVDALSLGLAVRDVQLPGATSPSSFSLDESSIDQLGTQVLELISGLVRAQAAALDLSDPLLRGFAGLTGMLGLRQVAGLPPLALADLPSKGISALVAWMEAVLADASARDAWLEQVGLLLDASPDAANDAVTLSLGPLELSLGVRVAAGLGGYSILTPWVALTYGVRAGVDLSLRADLFQADTATGSVTAVPALNGEAVFGAQAGGAPLLSGDPGIGSLRMGFGLGALGAPRAVLTLHDVSVAGRSHALLDLSTPTAALDAANDAMEAAMLAGLTALGEAGGLVAMLIGLAPPAAVSGIDAAALLADPFGELLGYWDRLTAPTATAAAQAAFGRLRRLLTGASLAPVDGLGTVAEPWSLPLQGDSGLRIHRDGTRLVVALAASIDTAALEQFSITSRFGLDLFSVDLAAASVAFATGATGRLSFQRADGAATALDLTRVCLEADRIEVEARWTPSGGLGLQLAAPGLALQLARPQGPSGLRGPSWMPLTLPSLDPAGRLIYNPDWDELEAPLAGLLRELDSPVIDALIDLLGWDSRASGRLGLGALITDARSALEAWLAEVALDCDDVRAVLGPVASLLSGFRSPAPIGSGSDRAPFRCPIAAGPRAPGIAVWLDPGCPPLPLPLGLTLDRFASAEASVEAGDIVRLCADAACSLPDVADLLVARAGLSDGLTTVVNRWHLTDGLVAAPVSLPADVSERRFDGFCLDELVALAAMGSLAGTLFDPAPATVVHVITSGCDAGEWIGMTLIDASGPQPPTPITAAAAGPFVVILPTPAAAAAARPDRGGVGEQAARLAAVLALRTTSIGLIAFADAGAAAVRAAHDLAPVTAVATVGSPWSTLALEALRSGIGGDALRFLARIARPDPPPWSPVLLAGEATAMERVRRMLARSLAAVDGAALPVASGEPRRSGVSYVCAFGSVSAEQALAGIAALVADGLAYRSEAARAAAIEAGEPAHTALHAALDLPVLELNLGELLIGAGARLEMLTLGRDPGGGLSIATDRVIHLEIQLGVEDGWLIGGPGAASAEFALRRMSAHVSLPCGASAVGATRLVLHEATAFGVFRERWVVALDGDAEATPLLPELRTLLGQVVARIAGASESMAAALAALGLVRQGGLDPSGLDRWLHEPVSTLDQVLADGAAREALAIALRPLAGAGGSGSQLSWETSGATVAIDLADRRVSVGHGVAADDGTPAVAAQLTFSGDGAAVSLHLGSLDPHAGGIALVASAGGVSSPGIRIDWQAPGAATPRSLPLAPLADGAGLGELATALVPAAFAHGAAAWLRSTMRQEARPRFEAVLDRLALLGPARDNGTRPLALPIGLFSDPVGWLRHAAPGWRSDPVGSAIALADALAPLVAPGRGTAPGWPIVPGLSVAYRGVGERLELTAEVDLDVLIDGRQVATGLVAGLSIGASGSPQLLLEGQILLDGRGLRVTSSPNLCVQLIRPTPDGPIMLVPLAGSLGSLVSAAGAMVLPAVLDALRDHRNDASASFAREVALAIHELLSALDLLDPASGATSGSRLESFAANPAAWTIGRLPVLAACGLSQLAAALDPSGTLVAIMPAAAGSTRIGFGASRSVILRLDSGVAPSITLAGALAIAGIGRVSIDKLQLSAAGVEVAGTVGPFPLDLGGAVLRPMLTFRAGGTSTVSPPMVGAGFALDDAAEGSVEVRWGLAGLPPTLTSIRRSASGESLGGPGQASLELLSVGVSLATGVALEAVGPLLSTRAISGLQGVLFADSPGATDIDPQLFPDLLDPDALLTRVKRLAWNLAASSPLTLSIDGTLAISLVGQDIGGARKRLGFGVSLAPGKRFAFPTNGDVAVELEVDAGWLSPPVPAGLTVFVLEGAVNSGVVDLAFHPSLIAAGLGLRFTKTSGPLLDLGGIAIDGLGLSLYGEVADALGGGVRLMLEGLAFAPSAGGGSNPLANSILNDAGSAGAANRPAFSPALAIQAHPGKPLSFNLRAGQPPGPWWIVIQRQLGPLYVERVGLDSAESDGTVSRITLLFDGSVSLFGLTAAVDQLSLSWLGGDVFDRNSWSVDLMGLAVSADMAGLCLSGGLLKLVDDGVTSYVGMLLGRFGIYGLSVFGGYADDHGTPSFFVFGAINGPIGGPPAFFLTGLGGGLGINRGLIIPTDLSAFAEYPFIKALDPAATVSPDPMGELRRLSDYFPPLTGNIWFAAGISFTSFALVDGVAVVAVSFGQGLEINLLGLARMALPRPQAALVSIELGLRARFSTSEGLFLIQAQLTENSWLLYEEVRLTGGYAFALWWKGPLRGQFVLTMGGYHPDFYRDGYPAVPRLGLAWRVSDAIVIKGGSYFALTSEALMAGVDVEISADYGWAWAKLSFGAHGIVYFDPFWFEVGAYVRISAGIEIETFLGDISLSISLGAQIRVWGPEFSGEATIEVGPCEFTVGFGSQRAIEGQTLDWLAFTDKYLERGSGSSARALSSISGRGTLPAATGGDCGAPSSDGSRDRPFELGAEFELSFVTVVPTTAFDLPGGSPIALPVTTSSGAPASLGISPMALRDLSSVMKLSLERFDPLNAAWLPMVAPLSALAANLRRAEPQAGGSTLATEAYPIGAWGVALPLNLPVQPLPAGEVLVAGNRLTLVAQAQTLTVGPEIDFYRVESGRAPLPLQANGAGRAAMRLVAEAVQLPEPASAEASLTAAEALLFAPRSAERPEGGLANGSRSRIERAAFAGERCAPPMFGSLFDGLDVTNGDAVNAERGAAPIKPRPPAARAPFVAGFLSAGGGAALRDPVTSVADGRIARRKAPSLASVEARLRRQLPVRLSRTRLPAMAMRGEPTLVAVAAHLVPRTTPTGATASFLGGPVGRAPLQGLVAGLPESTAPAGRRAAARSRAAAVSRGDPATTIRSGDVVVLQAPDALLDTATAAANRPCLRIAGAARVTVLAADGSALIDTCASDADVALPSGYAVVIAQADGLDPAGGDQDRQGLAGWHSRSRAVQIGTHAALAPGAVLTIEGSPLGTGSVAWRDAGEMTRGAGAVTTRFARPVRVLAVALATTEAARMDRLELELSGASLARDQAGRERDPIVVHLGATVVLIYDIEPHQLASPPQRAEDSAAAAQSRSSRRPPAPLIVRVRAGADWTLVGVLGGDGPADTLAHRVANQGLSAVAAKLLATQGAGATFAWRPGKASHPPQPGG